MVSDLLIPAAGVAAGVVFGLFGAGASAFATPMLALAGVPGALAVATPLPALLPASVLGARRHWRSGSLDRRVAGLAVAGGVPGAVLGALASGLVAGEWLLVASGLLLLVVGARVLLPDPEGHAGRAALRRDRPWLVAGAAFTVGLLSGLLANGGGFLLVPVFIVVLGLSTGRAAGTSMVAAGALTLPTLAVHWSLGHIDWRIAALFALGLVPGSAAGSWLATRVPDGRLRHGFGGLLVVFAVAFLAHQTL